MRKILASKLLRALAVGLVLVAIAAGLAPRRADAIINAPVTRSMPWSVKVIIKDATYCSAFVLTRHWVVTAAHCLDDLPSSNPSAMVTYTDDAGQVQTAYGWGPVRGYHTHPSFFEGDRHHDIGLVHLGGTGISPEVPVAPIYADDEGLDLEEWRGKQSRVHHTGYGLGSDPNEAEDCDDPAATSGGPKRLGVSQLTGWPSPTTGTPLAVSSIMKSGTLCGGDSGSPWALRNAFGDFVFAVHGGGTTQERATLLTPKMSWIRWVANAEGQPIDCQLRINRALRYRTCTEAPWRPYPRPTANAPTFDATRR